MNFNSLWFSSYFSIFSLTFLHRLSRRIQNVQKLSFIFFLFYTYYNDILILPTLVGCTRDYVSLLIAILLDAYIRLLVSPPAHFRNTVTLRVGYASRLCWIRFRWFLDGLLWLLLSLLAFDIFGWVAHSYYFVSLLILVSSSADVQ